MEAIVFSGPALALYGALVGAVLGYVGAVQVAKVQQREAKNQFLRPQRVDAYTALTEALNANLHTLEAMAEARIIQFEIHQAEADERAGHNGQLRQSSEKHLGAELAKSQRAYKSSMDRLAPSQDIQTLLQRVEVIGTKRVARAARSYTERVLAATEEAIEIGADVASGVVKKLAPERVRMTDRMSSVTGR